jgi:multicomponent Na+:H+ antiporter subunit G
VTGWITLALMWVGASFMLLAAVGIARLPDTFTRLQAGTKAVTLGVSAMMFAAASHFGETGVTVRAAATVLFLFATAPVAAHLIGRVAYLVGAEMWHGTTVDELRGSYEARRLGAGRAAAAPEPPDDDALRRVGGTAGGRGTRP